MGAPTSPTLFTRPCAVSLPFENEDELKRNLQDFFDSKTEVFYASGICDLCLDVWAIAIDTNEEEFEFLK